ncbi:MAG: GNAT family N-acetyltransferase [Acholeplasmataceae bacterium]|jgi:ElaA protein|nr:GNAT family N-acetyltransferase [Acholeplasmataceae bacterium]
MSYLIYKKKFHELTPDELYQILDLRSRVFIIEQQCIYPELDYLDQMSMHYMLFDEGKLVSYIRLIPRGYKYDEYAISRVVTDESYRNKGYATLLIKDAMNDIKGLPIRISGQAYLKSYYEHLGFKTIKGPYLEDDIPHYEMLFIYKNDP